MDLKDSSMPEIEAPPESGMSPMSPGTQGNAFQGTEVVGHNIPVVEKTEAGHPEAGDHPSQQSVSEH